MPAISGHDNVHLLLSRDWQETVGQSGMTPTAFSFLIPVFVVAIVAPFLCIFCIRKRRQPTPVAARATPKVKKPALRRAEAREKLKEITQISSEASSTTEESQERPEGESRSVLERECAICLSALHAPSPPEPAKLSPDSPISDAAAALPSSTPSATDTAATTTTQPESETILKLSVCGHEFHSECLVSWFVLRKTSCPICRSVYMSKEDMEKYDEEERLALGGTPTSSSAADIEAQDASQSEQPIAVRNWRYFLHGRNAFTRAQERQARRQAAAQAQTQTSVELQDRSAASGQSAQPSASDSEAAAASSQERQQSLQSRWRRFFSRT